MWRDIEFRDLDKLDIVGIYPNYASAYAAWKAKAQGTVDNAEMRYFIVHLHRLLDPEARRRSAEQTHAVQIRSVRRRRSRPTAAMQERSETDRPAARGGLSVRDRLPLALRFYRLASLAVPPVASRLLAWRLKRGKENPARLGERYGAANLPRPAGPLIWLHGASVGEMLAVIPLIERLRARRTSRCL